jgi:NAD(P)-dependent dehydrogenase (short-subunit alcohol dehydrogenase family)
MVRFERNPLAPRTVIRQAHTVNLVQTVVPCGHGRIGRATALALLADGFSVVLAGRSAMLEETEALAEAEPLSMLIGANRRYGLGIDTVRPMA